MPEKTGQITITKTGENNKKLSGAVFEIKAAKDIKTAGGTTLVAANTVVDTVTTDGNGSAASKQLELGQYIVKEKQLRMDMSWILQNMQLPWMIAIPASM